MDKLAMDYLKRAKIWLEILKVLYKKEDYSDVIEEAQEVVELTLKAVLRLIGVELPVEVPSQALTILSMSSGGIPNRVMERVSTVVKVIGLIRYRESGLCIYLFPSIFSFTRLLNLLY